MSRIMQTLSNNVFGKDKVHLLFGDPPTTEQQPAPYTISESDLEKELESRGYKAVSETQSTPPPLQPFPPGVEAPPPSPPPEERIPYPGITQETPVVKPTYEDGGGYTPPPSYYPGGDVPEEYIPEEDGLPSYVPPGEEAPAGTEAAYPTPVEVEKAKNRKWGLLLLGGAFLYALSKDKVQKKSEGTGEGLPGIGGQL